MNKYKQYVDEHIANVQKVWDDLQELLKGEFWIDDFVFFDIDGNIKEHDKSKYSNEEFNAYSQWFYPKSDNEKCKLLFDRAWNHHQKTNKHHWQYWIMWENSKFIALSMDFVDIIEMLCDWTAMSYKFGDTPSDFYNKNKSEMLLHKSTIECIKNWIPKFDQLAVNNKLTQGE